MHFGPTGQVYEYDGHANVHLNSRRWPADTPSIDGVYLFADKRHQTGIR